MKIFVSSANNSKSPPELLLIPGIPLNESVVPYGQITMNTNEEMRQDIEDYKNGNIGMIEF